MERICLITGANSGIGFELAKGMAQKGYHTVMLCRSRQKGEIARKQLIEWTDNPKIDLMIADLSSQQSIRDFVRIFNDRHGRLDVLFNNAGANFFKRELTLDKVEATFAVNYLSVFLLTNLLLPSLQKSDFARVVTTTGGFNRKAEIHFDDINLEFNFTAAVAANQAILAKFLFTFELSRRLSDSHITTNCFYPGAVKTNLQKKMPFMYRTLVGVMRPFFLKAEKGAAPGLYLATSKDLDHVSGCYFKRFKEVDLSSIIPHSDLGTRLWKLSADLTELNDLC